MGYVGAISEGVVTDRGDEKRILAKTLAECRRMRGTIEKLIALARLDRDPVNAAAFDVVALTRDVADSLKPLTPELHLQVAADGDTFAFGNASEVREALVCIIDNARKYAPGSPIDAQVTKTADIAVIEIADAGPGMSAEDRERAFERFRRGSAHGDVEGSGLGLAIAKRAVERANGRIALNSELGRGTTVRLYLPCVVVNGVRDGSSGGTAKPS
jgi:two-component system OmpR family sensor kinase